MRQIARLFAIALLSAAATNAVAADAVYPRGIRVGIVPMPGLNQSTAFLGFESADQGVKVLVSELPGPAFDQIDAAFKAAPEGSLGNVKPEKIETTAGNGYFTAEDAVVGPDKVRRYSLIVPGSKLFSGYVAVQVPATEAKTYSDEAVKKMLSSVSVRQQVPVDEQVAQMPFKIRELGDFKTVRTLAPGAALLLTDGNEEAVETGPFMVLGLIGSVPEKTDDRARFAQQAAEAIPGVRESKITMSEPIRIDGAPGFETRVTGVSGKDNTPVTVVQWLRFGSANVAMRVIGSSPKEQWETAFPRFRKVRDGLQPR
ncbi:hypothetical protein KQX63_01740 [Rhodopseudomonas palustris]|uniref:Uncharacterized protein n=1 Tax=Rhodopseudomonas palustris TaxID=1076 RepID=A0AAX3DZ31_RHOPL|nr:hypothetical protein [Rhodopseudomonas palustris]UYO40059.1 hypothetical protein KQX62_01750 [Rhodopseudomonas palustris]UYO44782.1 hypothetical protein KQX63_01740 [Rhodopseudomonas palustris]UYO54165.1 hypothetical protein KQX61_01750 [Rhodopseudomonas palustris]